MKLQAVPGAVTARSDTDTAGFRLPGPHLHSASAPHLSLVRATATVRSPATARTSDWSISTGKRVVDVAGALLALMLLAPVLLVVAMLVGFTSEGPVMFSQRRVGRLGELFTIYKFRTMHAATHHWGPTHTRCGDSRVTRVGRVLRKYKIDELPQFYNVLCGDMSLVGPRPKMVQHEGMHMPFRPGITGAATLAFRSEEEMLRPVPEIDLEFYYAQTIKPLKTQLDSEYMERATLASDVSMLLRTAGACVLPQRYHPMLRLNSPDLSSSALASFDLESLDATIHETGRDASGKAGRDIPWETLRHAPASLTADLGGDIAESC